MTEEIELTRVFVVAGTRQACMDECYRRDLDPTYVTTVLVTPATQLRGYRALPGDQIVYGYMGDVTPDVVAALFDRLRAIGFVFS